MGITEPINTVQTHFCFFCNGPGTSRWDEMRRICPKCRRLLQTWNVQKPNTQPRKKKVCHGTRQLYSQRRKVFLQENPFCWVNLLVWKRLVRSNTVHHRKGRGPHYLDESTWLATTKRGDKWIHKNTAQAIELGFLIESRTPEPPSKIPVDIQDRA